MTNTDLLDKIDRLQVELNGWKGVAESWRENAVSWSRKNAELRAAINQTLEECGYLADGDNCSLILLKRAVGAE